MILKGSCTIEYPSSSGELDRTYWMSAGSDDCEMVRNSESMQGFLKVTSKLDDLVWASTKPVVAITVSVCESDSGPERTKSSW